MSNEEKPEVEEQPEVQPVAEEPQEEQPSEEPQEEKAQDEDPQTEPMPQLKKVELHYNEPKAKAECLEIADVQLTAGWLVLRIADGVDRLIPSSSVKEVKVTH